MRKFRGWICIMLAALMVVSMGGLGTFATEPEEDTLILEEIIAAEEEETELAIEETWEAEEIETEEAATEEIEVETEAEEETSVEDDTTAAFEETEAEEITEAVTTEEKTTEEAAAEEVTTEETTEEETTEAETLSIEELEALLIKREGDYQTVGDAPLDDAADETTLLLAGSTGLNVTYHSQTEIANYLNSIDFTDAFHAAYSNNPNTKAPYSAGALTDAYLKCALKVLNAHRYLAGIPANVTLNTSYNEYCQAGVLLNAINGGLSHYPDRPDNITDDLYQKGYKGASSSNIAWGYASLGDAIVGGWMFDGDYSNVDRLGHRRWVLNPSMGQTGFGQVGTYTAMYAFDRSGNSNYSGIAWPAQNMPEGFIGGWGCYPWSLSMGSSVSKASVNVKWVNNGKEYNFGSSNSDGSFYIDNQGYGQSGCIIFVPTEFEYTAGNSYVVTVDGSYTYGGDFHVVYPVNFFDLDHPGSSTIISIKGDAIKEVVIGDALQLETEMLPASDQEVTWTSSNKKVATVDANGVVTALAYGKTTITVKTKDGAKATCTIQTRFKDMTDPKNSFYKAIYWAADNGIVSGYSNGNFGQADGCTRKQFAIMLYRYAGKPAVEGTMPFVDCQKYQPDTDTYKAILWASKNNIVSGYSDQTFRPDGDLTRKQTMIMLYRYAGKPKVSGTLSFADCQEFGKNTDTYKAILWGTTVGITNGTDGGKNFSPEANCLRRQIAFFLYKFHNLK